MRELIFRPVAWCLFSAALLILSGGTSCPTTALPGVPASGSPATAGSTSNQPAPTAGSTPSVAATILEQLSLERINRARLMPSTEASRYGIALDEGIPGQLAAFPRQPLALNAALIDTARAHSRDMLQRDYFAHNTPEGKTPFDRMSAAGYVFVTAGENLVWRGTTGTVNENAMVEQQHSDLFVDQDVSGRGHRITMLDSDFREVGIGILRGSFTNNGQTFDSMMQTQDYGLASNTGVFVLGVIYNDVNSNGTYDVGEGVANSTVSLGQSVKTTNAGGGYSFEVRAGGSYDLRFYLTNRSYTVPIVPGQPNVKIDLVNGNNLIVNLGLGPL